MDPIPIDGLAFKSLSAAGAAEKVRVEADAPSVGKAKARSIRAGLWHRVIFTRPAKTLPGMLLGGNDEGLLVFLTPRKGAAEQKRLGLRPR